jgi:hypothetical protein
LAGFDNVYRDSDAVVFVMPSIEVKPCLFALFPVGRYVVIT